MGYDLVDRYRNRTNPKTGDDFGRVSNSANFITNLTVIGSLVVEATGGKVLERETDPKTSGEAKKLQKTTQNSHTIDLFMSCLSLPLPSLQRSNLQTDPQIKMPTFSSSSSHLSSVIQLMSLSHSQLPLLNLVTWAGSKSPPFLLHIITPTFLTTTQLAKIW